jgi:hypothetical protein
MMWAFDRDEAEYDNPPREGLTPAELWDEVDDEELEEQLPDPRCRCGAPAMVGSASCADCDVDEALTFVPLKEVMQFRPDDDDP